MIIDSLLLKGLWKEPLPEDGGRGGGNFNGKKMPLMGSEFLIPFGLIMPELAMIGGVFSLWGMGEVVSGSMDIIDAAESGQIQE